jgi:predicted DNA-binding transcriptional regulator
MKRQKDSSVHLGFFNMLKLFQLKHNEMQVYSLLTKGPMTIKQLQKNTRMSERSLRTHLDDLVEKNFVKRKVIEGKHLKYVYYANSSENLLDTLKARINEIDRIRQKKKEEIIRGTEEFMQK